MFKELEEKLHQSKQELMLLETQYKKDKTTKVKEITEIEQSLKLAYAGINLDYLKIAKDILYITGLKNLKYGDSPSCIRDAIQDVLNRFSKLKTQYFGTKDYASWTCQRSDCEYGYSPRHGSIVFKIGLNNSARQRIKNNEEFTSEEIDACLYYLRHLDKIKELEQTA